MVDDTQARVMALIEPWNGRSLLTFRKKTLTPEMSLNQDMKLDPEDAAECLQNVFDAFGMDSDLVTFSLYYPKKPARGHPSYYRDGNRVSPCQAMVL
ncbi:Protein of uncharacterised function (DUF1493) [Pantoea agglomerans]|uniref:Protein of uncharacterized function (DUF1493) n=1 Tax=Enterobacter agglomerans TaxID=549 RepID=A0A379LSF9_ENTAG|nr:Protein of uncharacterised function (DUF1493) [Pantoea agglomerans]